MSFEHDSSTDNDSDYNDRDPGRQVVEKNIRNRLQRIADYTKDELNKVLKRVDKTLDSYEYSVQSSLIQHGMTQNDMSNVEHVADIKELESLLNDTLAKQRYKQRLMVFIVGQTEQASEKAKLLQQIEQFFNEQKQNFSSSEFNTSDDIPEKQDEIDKILKSFDVKDCYIHVQTLGTRLNELNEDIIQYLIQNAGTKQQAKGKKKLFQSVRETKEQLANLQSKLETANTEMINRDNKIETLEKEIEKIRNENTTNENKLQNELHRHETEIQSYKSIIDELEDDIEQYKNQIDDLKKTIHQSEIEETVDTKTTNLITIEESNDKSAEIIVPDQIDQEEVQSATISNTIIKTPSIEKIDQEIQTSYHANEISQQILSDNMEDLNLLFNSTDEIDLNNVTTENLPTKFTNLQKFATIRIRELLKELEIKESINNETVQKFDEYKSTYEKELNDMIEKADMAYQLQAKAQQTAEEAMNHLTVYMTEQDKLKPDLVHQETQTDEQGTLDHITSSPEYINPIEELLNDHSSSVSKITTEEFESVERFRRTSLNEKYISLIEEKKHELDQLKQQAEMILSRSPSSIQERLTLQSLEHSTVLIKRQPSISSDSDDDKEDQSSVQVIIKQDRQQQTSLVSSRRSSTHEEKPIQIDQFKVPFYHLYEIIYKFRHSIINLLEKNKFLSFADCLQMIKQLSSDDNNLTNDFIENSERVLKDIIKILQTCLTTLQSTINEYQIKEKEPEPIIENSLIDNQQSLILEQKELMIIDLTSKYEHIVKVLNQINKKNEETSNQNERLIADQQKLIQNLQQELVRLQKRLVKIEAEGIIEPSIMFTRLDIERNGETLQQAVEKGKVPETTYSELNEVMTDYVELPSQQLRNLVKRYIQFRKAAEIEDRIQSEILDNDTKNVLEKMESLFERRSNQISKRMSNIRQQRANLARILTEKFDYLEDKSSIFLIRPVYSYRGRTAAQSYMNQEKRRREALLSENVTNKRKHLPSRQSMKSKSINNQQILPPLSARSISDDEERRFRIEKSLPSPQVSLSGQQNDSNDNKTDTLQLSELTRLQELDIQRALLPVSHATTPLLSAFMSDGIDPCVPSLNLRSYVALSRSGMNHARMEKPNEIIRSVSRERLSTLSAKSQVFNPPTPYNSSAGALRRGGPPLPPIKRSLTSSVSSFINEKQHSAFVPPVGTNEVSTAN